MNFAVLVSSTSSTVLSSYSSPTMISKVSLLLVVTLFVVFSWNEVAADVALLNTTQLTFGGRWAMGLEGSVLVFRDLLAKTDSRIVFYGVKWPSCYRVCNAIKT